MKTDLFQSRGHCWVFQICWHIECNTFTASSFRVWNSSAGIPSPPLVTPSSHQNLYGVLKVKVKLLSRVRTLCHPMDCSLTGSSVHGIFQARVLEWVAISFSRRSSRPRDWSQVSRIVGRPSEPPGKPSYITDGCINVITTLENCQFLLFFNSEIVLHYPCLTDSVLSQHILLY